MSAFDAFLAAVEFIRPKYMAPFFVSVSMFLSSLFSPLGSEPLAHKFTRPEDEVSTGETMEITPDYSIIVGKNASASERNAADKLQKYLKEISEISLDIKEDTAEEAEKEIIVGKTSREGSGFVIDRTNLGDDGVVIKTVGKKIILSGAEQRGALYAVYTFLEEYFDCRWFTYNFTVIPKADKLLIPQAIDYTYVPPVTYRATDWISPSRSNEYKAANMLNDGVYGHISDEYGSGISYAGPYCHTFAHLVDTNLLATEPEIFALGVDTGERTTDQLCLTNPRTLELVIKGVRTWLEQNPNAKIVSVTQNDNQNYCVCENCKKIDKEEGSQAGTMLRFVNAIADDIKDDYPDVMVDTFAYQYTRKPPKITVPRDNVIVRLCSIECKFSSPISAGSCKENKAFKEDIENWSKICNNLHIWDYTTNYRNYLAPFGNFDVLQENIKFFVEHNVIGIYEEGNYQAAESNGEFAELRSYMLARLMWNPNEDVDKLMYEFCEAYYGDGAQGIVDFINFVDENNGGVSITLGNWWVTPFVNSVDIRNGLTIFTRAHMPAFLNMKKRDVPKVDAMWKFAYDNAKEAWQKDNVKRSEICWRYWKACVMYGEFENYDTRAEENKKLYDDFRKFGITRIAEWDAGIIVENPDFTVTPDNWGS